MAESPFVKFAESQQKFYARRDNRTLKCVLWFTWSAGRFGDVPWWLVEKSVEITLTPPQIEVRDPEKETRVREMLNKAGILSRKTWSAQEGLNYNAEQKNLAAEAAPRGPIKSAIKPNDRSSAESIEAFDPLKHPQGGNPKNCGEFSDATGPIGGSAKLARLNAPAISSPKTPKSVKIQGPSYLAQMAPASGVAPKVTNAAAPSAPEPTRSCSQGTRACRYPIPRCFDLSSSYGS